MDLFFRTVVVFGVAARLIASVHGVLEEKGKSPCRHGPLIWPRLSRYAGLLKWTPRGWRRQTLASGDKVRSGR
ncbi:hypothetical protein MTO96_014519 [Rhipicephalus appendiculatus]